MVLLTSTMLVRREAVVLAGRCYAQESVPYKALDSLIDTLTAHLCLQKRADVETVPTEGNQ